MNLRKIRIRDIFSKTKWKVFLVGTYLLRIKPFFNRVERKFLLWAGETSLNGKDLKTGKDIKIGKEVEGEETEQIDPNALNEIEKAFNIVYRYLKCEPCMKKGSCDHCGCTCPDNIIPEKNFCSGKNWGPMRKDIFEFLKVTNQKITITQIK